jgi:hypothetical protein
MPSDEDVAKWMLEQIGRHRPLYQDELATRLHRMHGGTVTYTNDNGNLAISKGVLKAFRKLSEDSIIWERGDRCWRLRELRDEPGRQQD